MKKILFRNAAEFWNGHLGRIFLLVAPTLLIAQLFTPPDVLIDLMNAVALSVALAVMVTYGAAAMRGMKKTSIKRGDILIVGIFWSWTAVALGRTVSILFRNFNYDLSHTNVVDGWVGLTVIAGIFHLNAPEVIEDKVPAEQWQRLGWITFAGVLVFVVLMQMHSGHNSY